MSIKKALFGGGVETNATASYQGSIQDWLPVKNIIGGVVITKDNRFIKILEIVPVNIYLKSAEDRQAIVEAFAAYLKIAPDHMQFEARTLPADISRYVDTDSLIAGTQNTFTVLSDSEELRRTLQTATAACMDNRTILHFDGNRLTLRCTGEVGSSNAALTVIPLTGQPFGDYCFAVDRLERCLRALRGTVTLGIAQTGMLTLSTEDAFYMQTQLRMTAPKAKSPRKKAAKAA